MANGDDIAQQVGFWETVRRAGFWRRLLALTVDGLIVLVPLQVLVIVLFAQTSGAVQGSFGFNTTNCFSIEQLPDRLDPAPPVGFNSITECRTSFMGYDMARGLRVAKSTQDGSLTTSVFSDYTLGADGQPNQAFATDWIAILILFAYLILMEYRSGATVGKRLLGIRTIDVDSPSQGGIPFRKAFLRQLAMLIGLIPLALVLIVGLALIYFYDTDLANVLSGETLIVAMAIAGIIDVIWIVWIIISVTGKRDPIYDRMAGTAVIRTALSSGQSLA